MKLDRRIQILHLIILAIVISLASSHAAYSQTPDASPKTTTIDYSQKARSSKKKLYAQSKKRFKKRSRKASRRLRKKRSYKSSKKTFVVKRPSLKSQIKRKKQQKFSLAFSTTYSESSINFQDGRDSQSLSGQLSAGYQFHKNFKLGASIDGYQDLNKRSEDYGDLHAFDLNGQLPGLIPKMAAWHTLTPILGLSLPLSKTLTEYDSLNLSLSAGLSNLIRIPSTKLSLSYLINYARNIHEFEESLRGFDNKQHILTNSFGASYQILDKLSLTLNFALSSRWTYESVYDSVFSSSQTLKYNLHKNMSLKFGHMNSGQTLHSDGRSSNIQLYNENSSGVFLGISAWI